MMTMRIIKRAEWGARHDDGFRDRRLPVDETWLHHSVTIAPDLVTPWDDDYAAVRTLEDIGEDRFGGGISYTYAITPAGLIFQGHSAHRSGAHTLNRNDIAIAIVWVGRYDTREPTEVQIRATAWLLVQCKRDGVIRRARIDGGHGQAPGQSTDCPGGYGRAAIARINQLAAQYERGEIDLSTEVADMTPEESARLGRLESMVAGLVGALNWTELYGAKGVKGKKLGQVVGELAEAVGAAYTEEVQGIETGGRTVPSTLGHKVKETRADVRSLKLGGTDPKAVAAEVLAEIRTELAPLFELAKKLEA